MATAAALAARDPAFDRRAGDDWVFIYRPNDVTKPGSTAAMQLWAAALVEIRVGISTESTLLATSADGSIITTGHTFGTGLVVPPTDFSVPILTWVVLRTVTAELGLAGKAAERRLSVFVEIDGVGTSVIRPHCLWVAPL